MIAEISAAVSRSRRNLPGDAAGALALAIMLMVGLNWPLIM